MNLHSHVLGLASGEADSESDEETDRIVAAAYSRLFDDVHEPDDLETDVLQHVAFKRLFAEIDEPPVTLGPYVIKSLIASGGMGVIYLGHHPYLRQEHAVKLLHPHAVDSQAERDRLIGEAQAMARLSHPNVVRVHTCGEHEGQPYIGMEFVDGTTLTRWHEQTRPAWPAVVAIYEQAGRGLAAAHAAFIIHGDFKPDNVLIGKRGQVQVVDFGLTTTAEPPSGGEISAANPTRLRGTPYYMAPEQFAGRQADARSDQFSFCVALFDSLFDGHPYVDVKRPVRSSELATSRGGTQQTSGERVSLVELAAGVQSGKLRTPNSTRVPRRVVRALQRGLARDPKQRYVSMDALLFALSYDPVKRWGPWLGAAVAGAAIVGFSVVNHARAAPTCAGLEQEFAAVWNDARRQEVRDAFLRTGAPTAEAAFITVEQTLTRYSADWLTAREATCQDPTEQQAKLECLSRARAQVEAVVDALTRVDAAAVLAVPGTLRLPDTEACLDLIALAYRCDLKHTDDALLVSLDEALGLESAGDIRGADSAAAVVIDQAKTTKAPIIEATARYLRARALQESGQAEDTMSELTSALALAEEESCDTLAADILSYRTKTIARHEELHVSKDLREYELVFSKFVRSGATEERRATAESDLGILLHRRFGNLEDAEVLLRRALKRREEAAKQAKVLVTPELVDSELNLSALLDAQGNYPEALDRLRGMIPLYEKLYSTRHPRTWKLHSGVGRLLLIMGENSEGLSEMNEALRLGIDTLGEKAPKVAELQLGVAEALRHSGRPVEALSHVEAADAILEYNEVPAAQRVKALDIRAEIYGLSKDPEQWKAALALRQEIRRIGADKTPLGLATADLEVAHALQLLGRFAEAAALCRSVLAQLEEVESVPAQLMQRETIVLLADLLLDLGQAEQSLTEVRTLLDPGLADSVAVEDHFTLAGAQWTAARALVSLKGDRTEACRLATSSLEYWKSDPSDKAKLIEAWQAEHCRVQAPRGH